MEKRLIDANKYREEWLKFRTFEPMLLLDMSPTVLTIPDNPTNGTMVMKIFNSYYAETDKEVVKIEIGRKIVEFDLNWWFAPYRVKSEDNNAEVNLGTCLKS